MRIRFLLLLAGSAGLLTLAAVGLRAQGESPETAYRLAPVSRGPVVSTVTASGTFRPLALVGVVATAPGQVREVLVDDNASVKAGDVLARLDDAVANAHLASAKAALAVAQGAVEVARGQLERAKSEITNADAQRVGAAADVDHATEGLAAADRDLKRTQKLAGTGDAARVETERAQAAYQQAQSALAAAKARATAAAAGVAAAQGDVRVAAAQLANAQAGVGERQAAVSEAELDLEHTLIRAPFDGVVLDRTATVGQLVGGGGSPLFTVASDLKQLRLHANVDEADIGRIAPGQKVAFGVDAYPNETFAGTVAMIKKAPQTVQNIVTYDVIVAAPNPDLRLFPGMTASARIVIAEQEDALRVPTAALRFAPPASGSRASGDAVWTVDEQGRTRQHRVHPGPSDGALTALADGDLAPGERVIVGLAPPAEPPSHGLLSF